MLEQIGHAQLKKAEEFMEYLTNKARQKSLDIEDVNVLVSYGGGKDSTWVTVFVRLVQLLCLNEYGKTFNIRLVTTVHPGMPQPVLDNINSVYDRLEIYSDEKVHVDIFCYGDIVPFDHFFKTSKRVMKLFRDDILLAGHRSQGDPRATFCYSCNLYMLNAMVSELNYTVHFVVTGDSRNELRDFREWLHNIFKESLEPSCKVDSFTHLAEGITQFSRLFFSNLHPNDEAPLHLRAVPRVEKESFETSWITIFDFTQYRCGSHLDFLTEFLGFKFSEDSFNFTESDCVYPLLMGHLRGLSAEIEGRGYNQGIREYLELVHSLMVDKEFPQNLIALSLNRYKTDEDIERMRKKAQRYTGELLRISEQQLKCMVYSPIAGRGRNLWRYLEEAAPELLPKIELIHDFLNGNDNVEKGIKCFLINRTGLTIQQLRYLYVSPLMSPQILGEKETTWDDHDLLKTFRKNDPNKKEIMYINSEGREVHEIIGGR